MKKTIIIVSIILLIGIIYYFVIYKKKVDATTEENPTKKVNTDALNNTVFPLKKGSTGSKVKEVQNYLNKNIRPPFNLLVVDGIFGQATEDALNREIGVKTVSEQIYKGFTYDNGVFPKTDSLVINPGSSIFTKESTVNADINPIINKDNVFSLTPDNAV